MVWYAVHMVKPHEANVWFCGNVLEKLDFQVSVDVLLLTHLDLNYICNSLQILCYTFSLHTVLTVYHCQHVVTWCGEIAFFWPLILLCKCRVHKSCLLLFAPIWFMRPSYSNKAEQGGLGLSMLVIGEEFKGVKGLNLVSGVHEYVSPHACD